MWNQSINHHELGWMHDIHSNIFESTNKLVRCKSHLSFTLLVLLQMSGKQTPVHNDLKKNYRLQLRLFPPPPHGSSSATPNLHTEKHTAFNILCKPHCLKETVEPKSIMK